MICFYKKREVYFLLGVWFGESRFFNHFTSINFTTRNFHHLIAFCKCTLYIYQKIFQNSISIIWTWIHAIKRIEVFVYLPKKATYLIFRNNFISCMWNCDSFYQSFGSRRGQEIVQKIIIFCWYNCQLWRFWVRQIGVERL